MKNLSLALGLWAPLHLLAQAPSATLSQHPNPYSQGRAEINSGHRTVLPLLETPPPIEGSGDLSAWKGALKVENAFSPSSPVAQGPPRLKGDLYLAWGRDALYVAVEVFCDPREVRGSLMARDRDLTGQDVFQLFLDPQGTGNSSVVLWVNSRNVQYDLSYVEGGNQDTSFDMIWDSATALTEHGWVAKLRVPFSSLRRAQRDWNFSASLAFNREGTAHGEDYPQYYPDVLCNICQSVKLAGAPIANEHSTLMVMPRLYLEEVGSRSAGTLGAPVFGNRNGGEFRYQATGFSAEGTYRPDFATVESDIDPLYFNNRYKYEYADKRPFFMNGNEVYGDFAAGLKLLSTRSVIDPTWGLKGTGKTDGLAWSVLTTRDAHGGDSLASDGLADTAGRQSNDGAFGLVYARGGGASGTRLSLAGTDRQVLGEGGGWSRSGGVSLFQQLGEHWNVMAQGVRSQAVLPGTDGLELPRTGSGTYLSASGTYEHLQLTAYRQTVGPDLRMDMGFIPLSDMKENFVSATLLHRSQGPVSYQQVVLSLDDIREWNGDPMTRNPVLSYSLQLRGPLYLTLTQSLPGAEWWEGERFPTHGTDLWAKRRWTELWGGQLVLTLEGYRGRTLDYSRGSSAREAYGVLTATLKAGSIYANLQYKDRSLRDWDSGALSTRARRTYLLVEQTLPHDFFWRVQVQPIVYTYPLATNPTRSTERVRYTSTQLLAGWRPNPFSGFYVGWNITQGDNQEGEDPRRLALTGRGLFLKATWAFSL